LRRELALLEHMDTRLWRKIVLCGSITIAAIAAGFFGLGYLAHVHVGLGPAIAICLAAAAFLYWVSRYEHGLFWLFLAIFIGVVLVFIFEDLPLDGLSSLDMPHGLDKKQARKAERRAKIARAISRRKMKLKKMLD
jgi:hypothetical protein